ncbi:MAG: hypothetical protein ACE5G2_10695 [Candidatus Krumholzibacteriia bacterium]
MRFGRLHGVAAAAGAVLLLALPAGTPEHVRRPVEDVAARTTRPQSCKPAPPLTARVEPSAPGATDAWTVHLGSLDRDRQVVVWMWSSPGGRQLVWQGTVVEGEERRVNVTYRPPADAARVWVSVEPGTATGAIMRGVAVATVPGRPSALLQAERGRLLVNPDSGERVFEYAAQVGGRR